MQSTISYIKNGFLMKTAFKRGASFARMAPIVNDAHSNYAWLMGALALSLSTIQLNDSSCSEAEVVYRANEVAKHKTKDTKIWVTYEGEFFALFFYLIHYYNYKKLYE
jgi:hypothetical protein